MVRSLKDKGLDASDKKLLSDIQKAGWHFVYIPEEDESPGWVFSVGLKQTHGHPEIIVCGLPQDDSAEVMNMIALQVSEGQKYRDGSKNSDLFDGRTAVFRDVDPQWYRDFMGYANWYYEGDDFPTLQCIWPDRKNHFPWHDDFDPGLKSSQPLLFETDVDAANARHFLIEDE